MKYILFWFAICFSLFSSAQQLVLKKGAVIDSVGVADSAESFALYLPSDFDTAKQWPILFVFDLKGRGRQVLNMFRSSGERQGYILAASNNVSDTLSISRNVLVANRMFDTLLSILPVDQRRIYLAGFSSGGQLASLIPTFINGVQGVISCGASLANVEVLSSKNPYHYIGIVGDEDFNYPEMINAKELLDRMKFPNEILVFDGGHEWPSPMYLSKALEIFTLSAMKKGVIEKDDDFVNQTFESNLGEISALVSSNRPMRAYDRLNEIMEVYKGLTVVDTLKDSGKTLRKGKQFKTQNRQHNTVLFKEALIKTDYVYYLEEDILTYNYNNLGWWTYQMEELEKYDKSTNVFERKMGKRLEGYLNALISDNIDALNADDEPDMEALNFLWMLKTITAPKEYVNYLNVISYSAKIEDNGTALFYLEELLKNGYSDKSKLYGLEGTALLRISAEFNEIVEKYLKSARYDSIEE